MVLCCTLYTDVAIKDLTSNVTAFIGHFNYPFSPPIPDACKDQGLKCPLEPNVMANFTTEFPLPKIPLKYVSVMKFGAVVWGRGWGDVGCGGL